MKQLLLLLLAPIFLSGCSKITIASVESPDMPIRRGKPVVFENDTLRITYDFWTKNGGGVMSYSVYNKLDEPVYIDWKNSAFIPNDKMMTYWQDETNTEGTASSSGYYSRGFSSSSSRIKTKAVRQERIAVIPPHSLIAKSQYALIPRGKRISTAGGSKAAIPSASDSSKVVKVTAKHFDAGATPLRFRNYITYAMNEKMEGRVQRVNNTFYVADLWRTGDVAGAKLKSPNAFFMR